MPSIDFSNHRRYNSNRQREFGEGGQL